jgi:protein arginine kinase activator
VFKRGLLLLLDRLHSSKRHLGKTPPRCEERKKAVVQIRKLQQELQTLVEEDRFEEAAMLRDRINELRKVLRNEPDRTG